ncbi:hypothetical protein DXG03_000885 [Asterophora parasitica]|uniref:Uncharacterized protein n=1 Tax=Asterophora parasitica TaxID=117018 RepID=A0A9P7FZM4_9AGAR|nr:hypothetical protein DXG03_000885 [Asterophora parasitica]
MVLRRRFQRHFDDALAAGLLLAPRTRRRPHRPKFFTACTVPGGDKWHQMIPVAGLPVQAKRRPKPGPSILNPESDPTVTVKTENTPSDSSPIPASSPPTPLRQRLLSLPSFRRDDTTPPLVHDTPDEKTVNKPPRVRVDMLQVSVLIAMPSPRRPSLLNDSSSSIVKHSDDTDDEERGHIPDVVFGITRLPFKHTTATLAPTPTPTESTSPP